MASSVNHEDLQLQLSTSSVSGSMYRFFCLMVIDDTSSLKDLHMSLSICALAGLKNLHVVFFLFPFQLGFLSSGRFQCLPLITWNENPPMLSVLQWLLLGCQTSWYPALFLYIHLQDTRRLHCDIPHRHRLVLLYLQSRPLSLGLLPAASGLIFSLLWLE